MLPEPKLHDNDIFDTEKTSMAALETFTGLLIHVVIPLIGIMAYRNLVRKIKRENIPEPPIWSLFFVFATYGSLLVMILSSFMGHWSGMASLGAAYLVLVAPFIMGLVVLRIYEFKPLSKYHRAVFKAAALYFVILPILLLTLWIYAKYTE